MPRYSTGGRRSRYCDQPTNLEGILPGVTLSTTSQPVLNTDGSALYTTDLNYL